MLKEDGANVGDGLLVSGANVGVGLLVKEKMMVIMNAMNLMLVY